MTPACEHYGLAILFAERWGGMVGLDFEDARQDAYLGILLALRTYDRTKGEFSTYASGRCFREMRQDAGSRRRARKGRQGVFVEREEYDEEHDWADPDALDPEEAFALEEGSAMAFRVPTRHLTSGSVTPLKQIGSTFTSRP
jgi:DNA-directed RNA polymerase specialized sigma24 family protein